MRHADQPGFSCNLKVGRLWETDHPLASQPTHQANHVEAASPPTRMGPTNKDGSCNGTTCFAKSDTSIRQDSALESRLIVWARHSPSTGAVGCAGAVGAVVTGVIVGAGVGQEVGTTRVRCTDGQNQCHVRLRVNNMSCPKQRTFLRVKSSRFHSVYHDVH